MTEEDYIKEQMKLSSKIQRENMVHLSQVQTVAGVDLAYWKEEDRQEYAVCCIVVIDYHTFEIREKVSYANKIEVPYIPGCFWKPTKELQSFQM